jgi:hypothetical protein
VLWEGLSGYNGWMRVGEKKAVVVVAVVVVNFVCLGGA